MQGSRKVKTLENKISTLIVHPGSLEMISVIVTFPARHHRRISPQDERHFPYKR
jgi:hypothetical protein